MYAILFLLRYAANFGISDLVSAEIVSAGLVKWIVPS
jgi:hypothetical protein